MIFRKIQTLILHPYLFVDLIIAPLYYYFLSENNLNNLLSTWQRPLSRNGITSFFFEWVFNQWINKVYLKETNPDRRETLKDIFMGGDSGAEWAQTYESRPVVSSSYGDVNFDVAFPWLKSSCAIIEKSPQNSIFIQLGCSSGKEVGLLAQQFPERQFIGSDIDDVIIQQAQKNHPRKNLTFKVERAHKIGNDIPNDIPLIVLGEGSLQYVQPEHLNEMFINLSNRKNVMIILQEPYSLFGMVIGNNDSRWRGNFSFSHEYRNYAKNAGFKIIDYQLVQPFTRSDSPHFHTKHYFLVCDNSRTIKKI